MGEKRLTPLARKDKVSGRGAGKTENTGKKFAPSVRGREVYLTRTFQGLCTVGGGRASKGGHSTKGRVKRPGDCGKRVEGKRSTPRENPSKYFETQSQMEIGHEQTMKTKISGVGKKLREKEERRGQNKSNLGAILFPSLLTKGRKGKKDWVRKTEGVQHELSMGQGREEKSLRNGK